VRNRDECDVVVPSQEGAAFEVVQPERAFDIPKLLLVN